MKSWYLLLLLTFSSALSADTLNIVASVRPLALMASDILGHREGVSTLLGKGESPHDFALTLSDRKRLQDADLVLWVGPDMEPYLEGMVDASRSLSLADVGSVEADSLDPHLWLSPEIASEMLQVLAKRLGELLPEHADEFAERAAAESQDIENMLIRVRARMQPYQSAVYLADHNAYALLANSIGVASPLLATQNPEIAPGLRRLVELEAQLPKGSCFLVDKSHRVRWVTSVTQRLDLKESPVDIMGDFNEPSSYYLLLRQLLISYYDCLRPA